MSMLKELMETAAAGATSAGAVAGFRGHFFGGKKNKKGKVVRRAPVGMAYGFRLVGEGYTLKSFMAEAEESDFDASDVIAKLKSAAKAAEEKGEDTVAFALEDEKGAMVKVWVPEDQADEFQQALEMALTAGDEDEDDQNDSIEIAEVLWKMRKDFDIINVEWGEIPEDQEEAMAAGEAPVEGETEAPAEGEAGAEDEMGAEEELGAEEDLGAEGGEEEMTAEEEPAGEEGVASALQQVIDAMKADAEARKAEAEAKAAQAKAEQAKYASQTAAAKVQQEEDTLEMEAWYDKKKEEKQEADRLKKLAKYKHEVAGERGAAVGGEAPAEEMGAEMEDEERSHRLRKVRRGDSWDTMMSKAELGDLVLKALRNR